jgi:hypothetical protein
MANALNTPPNRPMQPTPLAASKIAAILRAGFGYNDITIYRCGAADGQLVGRLHHCHTIGNVG